MKPQYVILTILCIAASLFVSIIPVAYVAAEHKKQKALDMQLHEAALEEAKLAGIRQGVTELTEKLNQTAPVIAQCWLDHANREN